MDALVAPVAAAVGFPVDQFKFIACVVASYPLGALFRSLLSPFPIIFNEYKYKIFPNFMVFWEVWSDRGTIGGNANGERSLAFPFLSLFLFAFGLSPRKKCNICINIDITPSLSMLPKVYRKELRSLRSFTTSSFFAPFSRPLTLPLLLSL